MEIKNNFNNYNSNTQPVLKGLNSNVSVQNTNINGINDNIKLAGNLNLYNKNHVENFNIFTNSNNIDQIIQQINTVADPNERSSYFRDLMTELLDDNDFISAAKVINQTPVAIYKNAMFKSFIQELVVSGKYETANSLIDKYPDQRVKQELKDFTNSYISYYGNSSYNTIETPSNNDNSILGYISGKARSIINTVGSWFSGSSNTTNTYDSGKTLNNLFAHTTSSNKIANSAESIIGAKYRQASLDYGNLACAYTVSQALKKVPGLENIYSAECNTLSKQLEKNGFSKAYDNGYKPIKGKVDYQPGDVVFFTRNGKKGYGHVGIVSEVKNGIPYMVHNSSSKREVVKVRLDQYYKTPVSVYRKTQ